MPLASLLTSSVFKDATLNLAYKARDLDWKSEKVREAAVVIRAIVKAAPSQADETDEGLMGIVDKVMRRFYPHHGKWDDPRLHEFLESQAALLEKVADDQLVHTPQLDDIFQFCEEMWVELSSFEMTVHRRNY